MSNNLPSIFPDQTEYRMIKDMATIAIESGLLPSSINTASKAIIIMMKGREIGIPPMQAFAHISVINGKPCMGSELMLSLIYKHSPNAIVDIIKSDETGCTIEAKRPNGKRTTFKFEKDDAERAQLLNKGPWKNYPTAMYKARCISAMARALFPDAINGISYTPEELGAEVHLDDNGEEVVKDVTPNVEQQVLEKKLPNLIPATKGQFETIHKYYTALDLKKEDVMSMIYQVFEIDSPNKITHEIAEKVIDILGQCKTKEDFFSYEN